MKCVYKPEISLIIPVYNEAKRLESCIMRVKKTLQNLCLNFEIIIAEDGSTDGSDKIVKELAYKDPVIQCSHSDHRLGRGQALERALKLASGKILIYVDADLSTDLRQLKDLINAVEKGADIATGSRLIKGAVVKREYVRELASRIYNLVVKLLFGSQIHDHQCGFKAFKRQAIRDLIDKVKDKHWFWDTELLIRATRAGYIVNEIPVNWSQSSESKVSLLADAMYMGSSLLNLFWDIRNKGFQSSLKSPNKRLVQMHYDSIAKKYDHGDVTYLHVRAEFFKDIKLRGEEVVLDLGCGTGKLLSDIINLSNLAIGIDLSRRMLSVAKGRLRKHQNFDVILCDGEVLPFRDSVFDLILCIETIEHIQSPLIMLHEVARSLKLGGLLYLTTPNRLWNPVHHLAEIMKIKVKEGPYTRHLTFQQLRKLIDLSFLKLTSSKGTLFAPKARFPRFFELLSLFFECTHISDLCIKQFCICKKLHDEGEGEQS